MALYHFLTALFLSITCVHAIEDLARRNPYVSSVYLLTFQSRELSGIRLAIKDIPNSLANIINSTAGSRFQALLHWALCVAVQLGL
jgi:hypothetical protein